MPESELTQSDVDCTEGSVQLKSVYFVSPVAALSSLTTCLLVPQFFWRHQCRNSSSLYYSIPNISTYHPNLCTTLVYI